LPSPHTGLCQPAQSGCCQRPLLRQTLEWTEYLNNRGVCCRW
jgi:hypothetical protein